MEARIKGSNFSWKMDETITPQLVKTIYENGEKAGIVWENTEFYQICGSLLSTREKSRLIEELYDENPEIIAEITVLAQLQQVSEKEFVRSSFEGREELVLFIRLYLPVFLLILENFF